MSSLDDREGRIEETPEQRRLQIQMLQSDAMGPIVETIRTGKNLTTVEYLLRNVAVFCDRLGEARFAEMPKYLQAEFKSIAAAVSATRFYRDQYADVAKTTYSREVEAPMHALQTLFYKGADKGISNREELASLVARAVQAFNAALQWAASEGVEIEWSYMLGNAEAASAHAEQIRQGGEYQARGAVRAALR